MQIMDPIALRLPEPLIKRIDAIVKRMEGEPDAAAERPTRAKVIRLALVQGLPALEGRKRTGR